MMMLPAPLLMVSPLIRVARVSSHLTDFNARNKSLKVKRLQQGYRYHNSKSVSLNFLVDISNWLVNIIHFFLSTEIK